MELFYKVTDEDIGGKSVKMENPKLRHGARGIVIREDGKIAVFNKSNKNELAELKEKKLQKKRLKEKL